MTKPEEVRIIRCSSCGGDGGHHDFAGQWSRCYLCDGDGEIEIEVMPIEMEDLDG